MITRAAWLPESGSNRSLPGSSPAACPAISLTLATRHPCALRVHRGGPGLLPSPLARPSSELESSPSSGESGAAPSSRVALHFPSVP